MNRTLTYSFLIPVYNNLDYTKKCLKDIHGLIDFSRLDSSQIKIIIIDDGSTDGTQQWVSSNYPDSFIIKGDGNLWWSGAINEGVKFVMDNSLSDYIIWWNNDIIPDPEYLENLDQIIQKQQSNEIIIGSKIFMLHSGLIWGMGGKFNSKTGKKFMVGLGKKDSSSYNTPIEVDWFPGMGTVFHHSVFKKAGLLDNNNFPQYHGDSDFTLGLKEQGFKLIAYPELIIYNDNSNTGISHHGSFRKLFQSMVTIKSNFNIKKNVLFLRKHATSNFAYMALIKSYWYYIGGFLKWKALNIFGIKKR